MNPFLATFCRVQKVESVSWKGGDAAEPRRNVSLMGHKQRQHFWDDNSQIIETCPCLDNLLYNIRLLPSSPNFTFSVNIFSPVYPLAPIMPPVSARHEKRRRTPSGTRRRNKQSNYSNKLCLLYTRYQCDIKRRRNLYD